MKYQLSQDQIDRLTDLIAEAYVDGYEEGWADAVTGVEAGHVDPPPYTNTQEEETFPIHNLIVDLSSYDSEPNFDVLCNSVDFVILRARFCTKTDPKFETWAAELNKRNMPFGVYDYVTLMNHDNARQQAEKLYELASKYNPRIYYVDTEQLGTGVQRGSEMEFVKTYVAKLRELGVQKVGHYTSDWLYSTYYYKIQDLFDTVWIASYGKNNGLDEGVTLKSATLTNKLDLHQYTDKGQIPGSTKTGDLSHLKGSKGLSWFTGRIYEIM